MCPACNDAGPPGDRRGSIRSGCRAFNRCFYSKRRKSGIAIAPRLADLRALGTKAFDPRLAYLITHDLQLDFRRKSRRCRKSH